MTTEKIDKDTFILRSNFYEQIQLLDRGQRGDLLTAIFAHARNEGIPELDGVTSMCFEFIRASIDSYWEKYNAKCLKNRENGKKGGRPKKGDEINPSDSEIIERFGRKPNETERENKMQIESEKTERFARKPNETERENKMQIESEKTERGEKNHYNESDSEFDIESDTDSDSNSTHTVRDCKEGGMGETNDDTAVFDMLGWVEANYPNIQQMSQPFDAIQMSWMLAKFETEDIKRIIGDMDNKGASKNKSAYSTFSSFAGRDTIIKEKKAAKKSVGPQYYSYDEMLAFIHKHGGKSDDYFTTVWIEGKALWMKK